MKSSDCFLPCPIVEMTHRMVGNLHQHHQDDPIWVSACFAAQISIAGVLPTCLPPSRRTIMPRHAFLFEVMPIFGRVTRTEVISWQDCEIRTGSSVFALCHVCCTPHICVRLRGRHPQTIALTNGTSLHAVLSTYHAMHSGTNPRIWPGRVALPETVEHSLSCVRSLCSLRMLLRNSSLSEFRD